MGMGERTIMEVLNLVCAHCDAPFKVLGMTQYVTCEECLSKLELRREGRKIFVDVLEASQQKPKKISDRPAIRIELECIGNNSHLESQQNEITSQVSGIEVLFKTIFYGLSILIGLIIFVGAFFSASGGGEGWLGASLFVIGITGLKYDLYANRGVNEKNAEPEQRRAE
jgi:hypothetical protein